MHKWYGPAVNPDNTAEAGTILLEEPSPNGSLLAVVEDDGRTVYVHLVGRQGSEFDTRSVWVRNRLPAPMGFDDGWEGAGRGPLMPFEHCRHPTGLPALDAAQLGLVWFPCGEAVALLMGDTVLAVIPPWAGLEGCVGYARDCTGRTPVAWPLGTDGPDSVLSRVREAQRFWADWDENPWPAQQRELLSSISEGLGPHEQYYAIDSGAWPPRFLVVVPTSQATVLITGGMSIRPQPQIERFYSDPSVVRHVELAVALDPALVGEPESLREIMRAMSRAVAFPWLHHAWLAPGHTIPCRGIPVGETGTQFEAFMLVSDPPGAPTVDLKTAEKRKVLLLWLVPITAQERQHAIDVSSDALTAALWQGGASWIHRDRHPVGTATPEG